MTIRRIKEEDLVLWADGTHCYYHELSQMTHMSDDFEIIPEGSNRYHEIIETA